MATSRKSRRQTARPSAARARPDWAEPPRDRPKPASSAKGKTSSSSTCSAASTQTKNGQKPASSREPVRSKSSQANRSASQGKSPQKSAAKQTFRPQRGRSSRSGPSAQLEFGALFDQPQGSHRRLRRSDRQQLAASEKRQQRAILNVHLPSQAARSRRLRHWSRRLFSLGVGVGLLLLSVAVTRLWLKHGVVNSNRVQLRHLEVQSNGWRDEAWVRNQLELPAHVSLLDLDLGELSQQLEADPGVVSARVLRELPDRLVVDLDERQPLAWLESPAAGLRALSTETGRLVDASGSAWQPAQLRPEWLELPVVAVNQLAEIPADQPLTDPALLSALELIQQLGQNGLGAEYQPRRLRLIDEGSRRCFRIEVTTQGRQQLLFSLDPVLSGSLAEQCQRLSTTVTRLAERGASLERLNLCLRDRLPAVLRPAGSATAEGAARTDSSAAPPAVASAAEAIHLNELVAVAGQEAAEGDYQELLLAESAQQRERASLPRALQNLPQASDAPALATDDLRTTAVSAESTTDRTTHTAADPSALTARSAPGSFPPFPAADAGPAAAPPADSSPPANLATRPASHRFEDDLQSILGTATGGL